MTLLRLWLVATAVVLAALLVWAFAPVLLFLLPCSPAALGRALGADDRSRAGPPARQGQTLRV